MEIMIEPGNEHEPRWIDANHENDLFHDAFLQANRVLDEIRRATEKYERTESDGTACNNLNNDEKLYGFSNNLIVFCGDRGQGKTSAMLSFARNLRFEKSRHDYLVLPTIDPTMLEHKDSILNVILARMFQKARDIWENDRNRGKRPNEIVQHELTECFQLCMEGIATNNSRKENLPDEFSSLDQLDKLGDSARLKHNFEELAKYLLKFAGCSDREGHIIIPLDDTDLQFQTAYSILEDIRKYLSIPHVVLLMALHLEQMRDLVEKQYASYFINQANQDKIRLRASRYMDKMFPAKHVIFLPRFEHFCRDSYRTLTLSYGDKIQNAPLQEGVLSYIYQKTGLLFVVPSRYLHNMIPSSLRGLSQLLNLLNAMDDIPNNYLKSAAITKETVPKLKESASIALRNLQMFESYFLHEWCVDALIPTHVRILESASRVALSIQIPKLYADILKMAKPEQENNLIKSDKQKQSDPWVTTYALLVKMLDEMASERDLETYRFCFAVHTYISIQLHKMMWWTRDEAIYIPETGEKAEVGGVKEYLSYSSLVGMLEGTLLLPARSTGYVDDNLKQDFSYYMLKLKRVDESSPELAMLTRKVGEKYYYDYTMILCGALLKEAGKIVADSNKLYSLQEACLTIVLNWDIHNQLRNLYVPKTKAASITIYDSLEKNLKEKGVYQIIGADKDNSTGAMMGPILELWNTLKKSNMNKLLFGKSENKSASDNSESFEGKDPSDGQPILSEENKKSASKVKFE